MNAGLQAALLVIQVLLTLVQGALGFGHGWCGAVAPPGRSNSTHRLFAVSEPVFVTVIHTWKPFGHLSVV